MNRIARVLATAVLTAALGCGLSAGAATVPGSAVHLSYTRMFGLESGRADFTLVAEAGSPGISIVSATVFGVDAPIPGDAVPPDSRVAETASFVRLPQIPSTLSAFDAIVLRVHQARMQVGYVHALPASLTQSPSPEYSAVPGGDPGLLGAAPSPSAQASAFGDSSAVGAYVPAEPATAFGSGDAAGTRISGRLGSVRFEQRFSATRTDALQPDAFSAFQQCGESQPSTTCPYNSPAHVQTVAVNAGTSFGVRAGNHRMVVDLTGGLERVVHTGNAVAPNVASLADPSIASGTPNLVALTKAHVGASLAVPVTRKVTVGAGYDTQHFEGASGMTFGEAIDARKNQVLGNITYQVNPKAAITFSARQSQYRDSYVPSFNFTQRQASLNVTVKF